MGWRASGWATRLQHPTARKVALVTINVFGLDPSDRHHHLALEPGSYCVASHPDVHVAHASSSRVVPYWPWLAAWPTITRRYWPQERRAEMSDVSIEVLADAGLTTALLDRGGGQAATGRVDLWTDGLDLDDVMPLLAGHVTGSPSVPRRAGGVSLRLADGDPDRHAVLPPGPITRADWPDAPSDVADVMQRQIIIGPFPERVPCVQVDAGGHEWYVCDPACTVPPTIVSVNGVVQRSGWTAGTATTPTGLTYTRIWFAQPASQLGAAPVLVDCSGGVGLREDGAIPLLLKLGGYTLSSRAAALTDVLRRQFDLSVLLNADGDVWQLVRDRLGAQTPYVFTQHLDAVDVLDAYGVTPTWTVGVGAGLVGRLAASDAGTDLEAVINALEIAVGRDAAAGAPLTRVYRDATHGPATSRSRCMQSQTIYGRRYRRVDAPDLVVEYDAFGRVAGSAAAERLADALLARHAFPWRPLTYLAQWWPGLCMEPGDAVALTDATEGYTDADGLVGIVSVEPTGPRVTVYVEART